MRFVPLDANPRVSPGQMSPMSISAPYSERISGMGIQVRLDGVHFGNRFDDIPAPKGFRGLYWEISTRVMSVGDRFGIFRGPGERLDRFFAKKLDDSPVNQRLKSLVKGMITSAEDSRELLAFLRKTPFSRDNLTHVLMQLYLDPESIFPEGWEAEFQTYLTEIGDGRALYLKLKQEVQTRALTEPNARLETLMSFFNTLIRENVTVSNGDKTFYDLLLKMPLAEPDWQSFMQELASVRPIMKAVLADKIITRVTHAPVGSLDNSWLLELDDYLEKSRYFTRSRTAPYGYLMQRFSHPGYPVSPLRRELLKEFLAEIIVRFPSAKYGQKAFTAFRLLADMPVHDSVWRTLMDGQMTLLETKHKPRYRGALYSNSVGSSGADPVLKAWEERRNQAFSSPDNSDTVIRLLNLKARVADPICTPDLSRIRRDGMQDLINTYLVQNIRTLDPFEEDMILALGRAPVSDADWGGLKNAWVGRLTNRDALKPVHLLRALNHNPDPPLSWLKAVKDLMEQEGLDDDAFYEHRILAYASSNPATGRSDLSPVRREGMIQWCNSVIAKGFSPDSFEDEMISLMESAPLPDEAWQQYAATLTESIQSGKGLKPASLLRIYQYTQTPDPAWVEKLQALLEKDNVTDSLWIRLIQAYGKSADSLSEIRRTGMVEILADTIDRRMNACRYDEELFKLTASLPVPDSVWPFFKEAAQHRIIRGDGFHPEDLIGVLLFQSVADLPDDWLEKYERTLGDNRTTLDKAGAALDSLRLMLSRKALPSPKEMKSFVAFHENSALLSIWQQCLRTNRKTADPIPLHNLPTPANLDQQALHALVRTYGGDADALLEAVAYLYFRPDALDFLHPLFKWTVTENDRIRESRLNIPPGLHPNEAELMLLLRQPFANDHAEAYDKITQALTSSTGFLYVHGLKAMLPDIIKAWGDIGFLTHSFLFWRYDTRGGASSMLAKYGFRTMSERATDKTYGKGFLLAPTYRASLNLPPDTLVEFRRGYLLVSLPGHGTLLIRNSSPAFGRDLLPHPAYFSPEAMSQADLRTLDPATDSRFTHLLDPVLYKQRGFDRHLKTLIGVLMNVKDDYRKWKFDTTAFNGETFSGYKSPGFAAMVQELNRMILHTKAGLEKSPFPELAFVHPEFPPFSPYKFPKNGSDAKKGELDRLAVTPEILKELNAMLQNQWRPGLYKDSELVRFIQTGIDNAAELIII